MTYPVLEEPPHDRLKHIVGSNFVPGQRVQALCGREFIPSENPDRYDWCQKCRQIAEGAGIVPDSTYRP